MLGWTDRHRQGSQIKEYIQQIINGLTNLFAK